MPAKFKLILILTLSIFASVGFYLTQHNSPVLVIGNSLEQAQFSPLQQIPQLHNDSEVSHYKTIPLTNINSLLQGHDPTSLALNFLEDMSIKVGKPQVEVELAYPAYNQASVTITAIPLTKSTSLSKIRYRVKMNTFGRSILVSSPQVWQITWVGVAE
jgi:hypothetical protein